ncbi:PucR family transcriptional regulator [Bacillus sonorensis]|uniref:PucR family transcriptional regulator n=1 Tax=Bacillus sonorensis TaxID=119858 RepID=UPI002DB6118B|nr:PucR family transcriptional regulator [Bacillus sonorensis]MEC1437853.1 PucR family transcriptional regulator [Bacillus sonorensis]
MNVFDIMQLPVFKGARLAAGESGGFRNIQHINMMDAPDIADFLHPGELLVTTAYHVKDRPQLLKELIEKMIRRGCAGLGIKTKRFLREIPKEVIEYADKKSFPIIELNEGIRLGDIVNHTLSHILDKRTAELEQAINAQKQFTDHVMSGKSIQSLLKNVSRILDLPVLLLNQHLKPRFSSGTDRTEAPPLYEGVFHRGSKTAFTCFSTLSKQKTYSVFPIYTHEKKCGFLVVCGMIPSSDKGLLLTIEQAANVIGFELMKENALKQYARRARNEFFSNFLDGAFSSPEEIKNRAKEFQLKWNQKYICIAGKLDRNEKGVSFTENQLDSDSVFEFLEEELNAFPFPPHLFIKGNMCILLAEGTDSWAEMNAPICAFLRRFQQNAAEYFQRTISFGISNLSHQLFDAPDICKEAVDALHSGHLSGSTAFIQTYHMKDVSELLRMIPIDDLKKFHAYTLQNLANLPGDDQVLLHTLSVYLETHCQISETAKRLYVHRNTVIYRLEKCEEMLGKSLKDADTTLRLRLALRIQMLLGL